MALNSAEHRECYDAKVSGGEIDFKFDIRRNSSFDSYLTRRSNDLHLPPSKEWNNLDNDM